MDRKKRSARSRKVADRLKMSGDPALETPLGREYHLGMAEASPLVAGAINQPVGARPKSDETAIHDAGSGANETIDGLNATEEALRRGRRGHSGWRLRAGGRRPGFRPRGQPSESVSRHGSAVRKTHLRASPSPRPPDYILVRFACGPCDASHIAPGLATGTELPLHRTRLGRREYGRVKSQATNPNIGLSRVPIHSRTGVGLCPQNSPSSTTRSLILARRGWQISPKIARRGIRLTIPGTAACISVSSGRSGILPCAASNSQRAAPLSRLSA